FSSESRRRSPSHPSPKRSSSTTSSSVKRSCRFSLRVYWSRELGLLMARLGDGRLDQPLVALLSGGDRGLVDPEKTCGQPRSGAAEKRRHPEEQKLRKRPPADREGRPGRARGIHRHIRDAHPHEVDGRQSKPDGYACELHRCSFGCGTDDHEYEDERE